MTRILLLLAPFALTIPVAVPAPIGHARVWVSARSPLEISGSGFKPNERVTVTVAVSGGERFDQAAAANNAGSFVVRCTGSATGNGRCPGMFVKAAGDRGSTASWRSVADDCADGPAP
jgi:hypothetical protein